MFQKVRYIIRLIQRKFRQHVVLSQVASHNNSVFIGGYTRLSNKTHLGKNISFNGLIVNGVGKLTIGDNFHSGTQCLIITSIHNYDFGSKIPYDETHISKDVLIGDNVWFGDRVTILGAVTIEEGAIIQAGAVVVKDVPAGAIVGGNPAQIFKYRNMVHYNKLKKEQKFN